MGLDVYFRRDIANVLRATACSSESATALAIEMLSTVNDELSKEHQEALACAYRAGVRNTLISVGLAFGLEPAPPDATQGTKLLAPKWAEVNGA